MAEILDLAATWTCGGAHVSSHRSMPMWQQRERILPALKSKVDESTSVGVQEASGFKLDWFDWLWESSTPVSGNTCSNKSATDETPSQSWMMTPMAGILGMTGKAALLSRGLLKGHFRGSLLFWNTAMRLSVWGFLKKCDRVMLWFSAWSVWQ